MALIKYWTRMDRVRSVLPMVVARITSQKATEQLGSPVGANEGSAVGTTDAMVRVEGLSHCFAEIGSTDGVVKAIDDVSLELRPHTFTSLVGASGCGKTTLLNLVAGLEKLQYGTLEVNGAAPRQGRPDVAYMLARDALLPWRTIEQNAAFGLNVRGNRSKAEVRQIVHGLLDDVGLADFARARPRHLSHGMRQRAALARTFALDSSLLLMDEPFGALDAQTKLQLQRVLTTLWERDRRTVLMVTHDLHEAIVLSDEIIVMSPRPGRIKRRFKVPFDRPRDPETLLASHEMADLYGEIRKEVGE